ncbi:MAG: histidinol-phosphatase HisJ family protein [Clostridiales bacterium]|nr:histidinol-phosphatase HisJ family protein [Clostridiales bacterium]
MIDQHVHSACSIDADTPMKDMALAAADMGLDLLCFTDHCDLEHHLTGLFDPGCFDRDRLISDFSRASESVKGKLRLRLGLELGAGWRLKDKAAEIAAGCDFDLIIGSVHNLPSQPDFYFLDFEKEPYRTPEACKKLFRQYIGEHFEMIGHSLFDVIGHIGYPLRYMKRAGIKLSLSEYYDEFSLLFRKLIESGKGIEVNTAGLRKDFGQVLPLPGILKLYRQSGGEIVTIGSDAHDISSLGTGIREAQDLLEKIGFRYFTVFTKRKPEFFKL